MVFFSGEGGWARWLLLGGAFLLLQLACLYQRALAPPETFSDLSQSCLNCKIFSQTNRARKKSSTTVFRLASCACSQLKLIVPQQLLPPFLDSMHFSRKMC